MILVSLCKIWSLIYIPIPTISVNYPDLSSTTLTRRQLFCLSQKSPDIRLTLVVFITFVASTKPQNLYPITANGIIGGLKSISVMFWKINKFHGNIHLRFGCSSFAHVTSLNIVCPCCVHNSLPGRGHFRFERKHWMLAATDEPMAEGKHSSIHDVLQLACSSWRRLRSWFLPPRRRNPP